MRTSSVRRYGYYSRFSLSLRDGEEILRPILKSLPEGVKAARLDWKDLAEKGRVPELYNIHRQLSGVSAHVTGMSILPSVEYVEGLTPTDTFRESTKASYPIWMMAATLHGSLLHAGMIDAVDLLAEAIALAGRLNVVTAGKGW